MQAEAMTLEQRRAKWGGELWGPSHAAAAEEEARSKAEAEAAETAVRHPHVIAAIPTDNALISKCWFAPDSA